MENCCWFSPDTGGLFSSKDKWMPGLSARAGRRRRALRGDLLSVNQVNVSPQLS